MHGCGLIYRTKGNFPVFFFFSSVVQENTDFTSKEEKGKGPHCQEQTTQHPMTNSTIGPPSRTIRLLVAWLSWVVPLCAVGSGQPHEQIYSLCTFAYVNNPLTQTSHTKQSNIT